MAWVRQDDRMLDAPTVLVVAWDSTTALRRRSEAAD
jgi:hypothetical protein